MSTAELYPILSALSRYEKLLVMQFLLVGLIEEETTPNLDTNTEYPIYTPSDQFEAAGAMMALLEQEDKVYDKANALSLSPGE